MATKSISQLDSAVSLALGDLFEIAEPDAQSQTGYASKKISMSQAAKYVQEDVSNASLNTTDKTLVGAINEVDSEGVKWESENILGSKNLFVYPYAYASGSVNSIDYEMMSDGSIHLSGTADRNTYIMLVSNSFKDAMVLKGDYIARFEVTGTNPSEIAMIRTKNENGTRTTLDYFTDKDTDYPFSCIDDGHTRYDFSLRIYNNRTVNVYVKPMIRLATVKETTWEPPSNTNRQLTTQKVEMTEIAPIENGNTASQAYTIGDYMFWKGGFYKVTAAISASGAITEGTNVSKTTIGAELKAALA